MEAQERIAISVRLSAAGLAEIERMAAEEERDRSSMIRILLREAVTARQKRSKP
jgi:metal-responsive CopG/Arc/MetJ family transcriptional regulator